MTWVKLEDGFPSNRKVLAVSPTARYLYVVGLCYCSASLTDGEIPAGALPILHAQAGSKPGHARELVAAGLWVDGDDGVTVHDYLTHQRSRSQVDKERDGARDRKRESRARHAVTPPEVRAPETEPETDQEPSSPIELGGQAPEQGPPFEQFWTRYPRRNGTRQGKAEAQAKWKRMTAADREAALDGVDAYAARAGDYPKDAVRYLKSKLWLDDDGTFAAAGATVVSIVGPCRCGFDGDRGDPAHQAHHRRYIESLAEEG